MKKKTNMFDKIRKEVSRIIYTGKNSMSLPNEFLRNGGKVMRSDWSDVQMDDRDHYSGYSYAAITKRARAVARIGSQYLTTKVPEDKNTDKANTIEHPYIPLIRNSLTFSENQFWGDISTYLDLEGIYYLMVIRNTNGAKNPVAPGDLGKSLQYKLLNPYNIRRVINPETLEVAGYIENRKGFQREIPAKMIIEIRELNPFDEDTPLAMTDASKESAYTIKSTGDYTRSSLRNNLDAPGIISTDIVLEPEKFKNFVARMKGKERGEPVFANGAGAITWEAMDVDLSKAALKDINEVNRDTLLAVTGMSKTMMGIEQSGTTRETSNTQKDLFIENEIVPRINLILDALNLDYKNRYNAEYTKTQATLGIINPIESDQDVEGKKAENKTKAFELFDKLVAAGYEETLAAQFVNGEIGLEKLGKPTQERRPDPKVSLLSAQEDVKRDKKKQWRQLNAIGQNIVDDQEAMLQNAIVNVEGHLVANAIARIPKKIKNAIETEDDLITKTEKKESVADLIVTLTAFYGIVSAIQGQETMNDRVEQFGGFGKFLLDRISKDGIKKTAEKVAESHVDTVADELFRTAREAALQGKSQLEIISELKTRYAHDITENRARLVARTETNRAFTMAQYDADRQFIAQNNLQQRAYKQYHTRSLNPCAYCKELESQGLIPFDQPFVKKGGKVSVEEDGKTNTFTASFESVYAGNLHPNCSCDYTLIITQELKK